MQITITLTESEAAAISYNHTDFDFYINSIAIGQVNLATDEIVGLTAKHCIDNNIQIPGTKEEIVALGFSLGVVESGADRLAKTADYTPQTV